MKVLILCTGNSCRSQMAEGLFSKLLNEKYPDTEQTVCSAGTNPQQINKYAVEVMNELGIDLSNNKSSHLLEYIDDKFDYIITVCDNAAANCPVFPGGGIRLHWPFEDPADTVGSEDEITEKFREVRNQIQETILDWLNKN